MKILLAGATGYLGRHLLAELIDGGHEVRALARSPERLTQPGPRDAPIIEAGRCQTVAADVTKPKTLDGVTEGMDAVVSTVGVTGHGGDPWAVDYRGNLALFDEARRTGIDRFVYVHVLHGEDIPADLTRAKSAFAEVLRRSGTTSGISFGPGSEGSNGLVINPTGYFSDMTAYLEMARKHLAMVVDGGHARVAPIHGADLAAFIRRHLEAGTTGDLDVGGPETMTHREVARLAFDVLGRRPRLVSVPSGLLRAGVVPVRVLNPARAGTLSFLLAGLTQDAVAPATGTHRLREHFKTCLS
ncbi:SDR family oxidoreductase [Citricoccus sp. GCM10030269]|uniref:SDR family oxidoreductase n=1 Tax=Citricoccus sp. GCM10030269 TaxID=3273388 RepID=UPI00360F01CD